jgi:hypothetical protein
MALTETDIVGGVDTHKDSHTVAALSGTGQLLPHNFLPQQMATSNSWPGCAVDQCMHQAFTSRRGREAPIQRPKE